MYFWQPLILLWSRSCLCPALGLTRPLVVALHGQGGKALQVKEPSSAQAAKGDSKEELEDARGLEQGASIPEGLIYREAQVWRLALNEAKLDKHNISSFGRSVGKIPRSWVDQVNALDHAKNTTYNFQGSYFASDVHRYRRWVFNFAKRHFTEKDFLRFTDAPSSYVPMGSFDKTNTPGGFRPKDYSFTDRWTDMDPAYFQILLGSNFTLCPRGDRAFSYRFYESALSYSIPVVSSLDVDLAPTVNVFSKVYPQRLRCIGYHYYSLDDLKGNLSELVYRRDWAEENYELFIKYQTFIKGDNVPPRCPPTIF